MVKNCCDFSVLEAACAEYTKTFLKNENQEKNEERKKSVQEEISMTERLTEVDKESDKHNTDKQKPMQNNSE